MKFDIAFTIVHEFDATMDFATIERFDARSEDEAIIAFWDARGHDHESYRINYVDVIAG